MGSLKKIFLAITLLVIVYYLFITFSVLNNNYPWKDMDWNKDGTTSISEFIYSTDVGKRLIKVNGNICKEYFSLKDGLSVKQVCENKP